MPQTILTDDMLCKLAKRNDLRGVTPCFDSDGRPVWRARLFYTPRKSIQVGTFQTAIEAINAVRAQAAHFRLPSADEKLFWKDSKISVRGVQWDKTESCWRVSLVRVKNGLRTRYLVGYRDSLLEAIKLCLDVEHMTWAEIEAYSHKTNARPTQA